MACKCRKMYSVYHVKTDVPLILYATAEECAKAMGISVKSFYRYVQWMQDGEHNTQKWNVYEDVAGGSERAGGRTMLQETSNDKNIKNTTVGGRIYTWWRKVRKHEHAPSFNEFSGFYEWAAQTYVLDATLKRKDPTKPYSTENCYFLEPKKIIYAITPEQKEWMDEWDRAVNRIRKYFNMPPLPGTSYEDT